MAESDKRNPMFIDRNCVGCRYYRPIHGKQMYCDYIFAEDKKRPCDPGKDCTVKAKRRRKKKNVNET